jgi:hypothetical protein
VKVSRVQLLLALMGVLGLLTGLNKAVAVATRNSIPRRLMARVPAATDASVLALGNSLVAVGIVEPAFDQGIGSRQNRGILNLALGASSPIEQLLLLRYALHSGLHPATVIYGFYDFQLTHPVELATGDMIGNHAMLYYVEPEYARGFYHLSWHDRIEFEIMRHFPLFTDQQAVWARVEQFRRRISRQGMPEEKTNALGRANDFELLEFPSTPAFIRECGHASRRDLIPPVSEIVRQASEAGSKVVFIEMPMPPAHVASFYDTPAWQRYRGHLKTLLGNKQVTYIDASHWMPDESMFLDPLHMTYEASLRFSQRLGESLREDSQRR